MNLVSSAMSSRIPYLLLVSLRHAGTRAAHHVLNNQPRLESSVYCKSSLSSSWEAHTRLICREMAMESFLGLGSHSH